MSYPLTGIFFYHSPDGIDITRNLIFGGISKMLLKEQIPKNFIIKGDTLNYIASFVKEIQKNK